MLTDMLPITAPSSGGDSNNVLALAQDFGYSVALFTFVNEDYFEYVSGTYPTGYTVSDLTFRSKVNSDIFIIHQTDYAHQLNITIDGVLTTLDTSTRDIILHVNVDSIIELQHSGAYDRSEYFIFINPTDDIETKFH